MGKVAAAVASTGVLGTGGAATLAAHQMGAFGGGRFTSKLDPVQTLSALKINAEGGCIGKGFGQVREFLNIKDRNVLGDVAPKDIKLGSKAPEGTSGCLYVSWSKTKGQGDALKGTLEITWATWGGTAGFLVYLKGDAKEEGTMAFDGIAYVFEKDNQGWKPSKKMNASPKNNVLSGQDLLEKFPKKGNIFVGGTDVDEYWNFLDSDGKVKKVTGKEVGSDKYAYTWADGAGGGGTEMSKWSSNMDKWWSYFFDGSSWDMAKTLDEIKGTWTKPSS